MKLNRGWSRAPVCLKCGELCYQYFEVIVEGGNAVCSLCYVEGLTGVRPTLPARVVASRDAFMSTSVPWRVYSTTVALERSGDENTESFLSVLARWG